MKVEQAILNYLQILPPEKQKLLLEFAEFLKQQLIPQEEEEKNHLISPQEKATKWKKWAESPPISPQKKASNWKKWAESHQKPSPGLSDEAISRETIYK